MELRLLNQVAARSMSNKDHRSFCRHSVTVPDCLVALAPLPYKSNMRYVQYTGSGKMSSNYRITRYFGLVFPDPVHYTYLMLDLYGRPVL